MRPLRYLTPAREEFLESVAHYELQSPGLGLGFIEEVEHAIVRLAAFPEHGSPHLAGTRRIVLGRFPFDVVYLAEPQEIVVVAVAHHKREPGYWRGRV
ncbi:MAG: type II toxin-antitoxin system RelE/ParE family toxin [bacterium]